jgi:hypothetical protein
VFSVRAFGNLMPCELAISILSDVAGISAAFAEKTPSTKATPPVMANPTRFIE